MADALCEPLAPAQLDEVECRICKQPETSADDPLFQPCACRGSLAFAHCRCLQRWIECRLEGGTASDAETCEVCKTPYRITWRQELRMDRLQCSGTTLRHSMEVLVVTVLLVAMLYLFAHVIPSMLTSSSMPGKLVMSILLAATLIASCFAMRSLTLRWWHAVRERELVPEAATAAGQRTPDAKAPDLPPSAGQDGCQLVQEGVV